MDNLRWKKDSCFGMFMFVFLLRTKLIEHEWDGNLAFSDMELQWMVFT